MFKPLRIYKRKFQPLLLTIVGGVITIGFGALFISGALMNTFLSFLPLLVHKIIGWSIIGIYALSILFTFKKR